MSTGLPFIAIYTEQVGGARYQEEAGEFVDFAFPSVEKAVEHTIALLENETIQEGMSPHLFVLNTVTGETHCFRFEEQPRKFIARAV